MSYLVFDNADLIDPLGVPASDLPKNVLSYDIETTGLDPHKAKITEISFSDQKRTYIFSAENDEFETINNAWTWFDQYVQDNPLTRLVSWNGWGFDGPWIQVRVEHLARDGKNVRVWQENAALTPRVGVKPKYPVAGGYEHPQTLVWRERLRDHDIEKLFMRLAHSNGIRHGLKPVGKFYGYTPIEVDRTRMDLLTREERVLYAASDTITTIALAGKIVTDR